jgi:hypothetical protein
MIISVSRRCDIPRFRFEWFLERLREGFVDVTNPFNAAQVRRVSLLRENVDALIFWTRDPRALLSNVEKLKDFTHYVMVTVTGYPSALEPNVPAPETVCAAMAELARKLGNRRVIWRYDPVFLSSISDFDFHRRNFSRLAELLRGSVQRVIISLYDEYRGAKRRIAALEKSGLLRLLPETDGLAALLAELAAAARAAGMDMQSCAQAEDFSALGIKPGACIDGGLLRGLWGISPAGKDGCQRPHCLCAKSVDIGSYGACPAGCAYCYARR